MLSIINSAANTESTDRFAPVRSGVAPDVEVGLSMSVTGTFAVYVTEFAPIRSAPVRMG